MEVYEARRQPQASQIEFGCVIGSRVIRPQVCPDPPVFEQQISLRRGIPLGVEELGVSQQYTGHDEQCSGCGGPPALKPPVDPSDVRARRSPWPSPKPLSTI